jgi:hypothetical protein
MGHFILFPPYTPNALFSARIIRSQHSFTACCRLRILHIRFCVYLLAILITSTKLIGRFTISTLHTHNNQFLSNRNLFVMSMVSDVQISVMSGCEDYVVRRLSSIFLHEERSTQKSSQISIQQVLVGRHCLTTPTSAMVKVPCGAWFMARRTDHISEAPSSSPHRDSTTQHSPCSPRQTLAV